MICPKKLAKILEKSGMSHKDAIAEAWCTTVEFEKLTAAQRKKIPKSDFGKPSTRSPSGGQGGWPLNDCTRVKAAKAYYPQHGGNDPALKAKINAAAKGCGLSPVGEKTEQKEDNWSPVNVDDANRLRNEGLAKKKEEDEKKYGQGQWGEKTESCIQDLHGKQGKEKSSAIAICRDANKDA